MAMVIYLLYFCFADRSYQPGSHFTPKQAKFGHENSIVTKSLILDAKVWDSASNF